MPNLARESMFERIQNEIRALILRENLQPGDMLPPASQLAEEWGVSLASLREAMRSLEAIGVLEMKHGSGTFIREFDLGPLFKSISFCLSFRYKDLADLLQARRAMETGLLAEVMAKIPAQDLDRLEDIAIQIGQVEDQLDLDYEFHKTLFACLDNAIVNGLIDMTWVIYRYFYHRVQLQELRTMRSWRLHAQLVEDIRADDLPKAIQTWQQHFDEGSPTQVEGELLRRPEDLSAAK